MKRLFFLLILICLSSIRVLAQTCEYQAGTVSALRDAINRSQVDANCTFIYIRLSPTTYHFTNAASTTQGTNALPNIYAANKYIYLYGNGAVLTMAANGNRRLIFVDTTGRLNLYNATVIAGNVGTGYGGAIFNRGSLYTNDVIFSYNSAGYGGAIFNDTNSFYNDGSSQFNDNSASFDGGAIYSRRHTTNPTGYGTTSLYATGLFYNQAQRGGAIFTDATTSLYNVYLGDNTATNRGGAVMISRNDAPLSLYNSTLSYNQAPIGGGISSIGLVNAFRTQFMGNQALSGNGGAINAAIYSIDQSVFRYNYANSSGGAIYGNSSGKTQTISRSEFSSNSANIASSLYLAPSNSITVSNSTFAYNFTNTYGDLVTGTGANALLAFNTVMTFNTSALYLGGGQMNLLANVINASMNTALCANYLSQGYNVFNQAADRCIGNNDKIIADPRLGNLSDNSGGSLTFPLLAGSPLANQVPYDACDYAIDQRGVRRYHYGGCDIGAFESDHLNTDINFDRLVTARDGVYVTNRRATPVQSNALADIDWNGVIDNNDVQFVLNNLSPSSIRHFSCPSLQLTCQQLTTCAEAMACDFMGNANLDSDRNGIPCDESGAGAALCLGR